MEPLSRQAISTLRGSLRCSRTAVPRRRPLGLNPSRNYRPVRFASTAPKTARPFPTGSAIVSAVLLTAGAVATTLLTSSTAYCEAPPGKDKPRSIRLSEVRKHGRDAKEIWVVRGVRVYDVTEWLPNHPGGDVMLRAAGGSVDTYWKIFTIHKKQDVYDILEQYFIGELDPRDLVDGQIPSDDIEDPFVNDPKRNLNLCFHTERPCNAETPCSDLGTYITSNSSFYVRNHLWVPEASDESHKLTVELIDGTEKEYTIGELKSKFKEVKVTATLQCSGNRRKHMTEESRATNGLQWDVGAIGNAEWGGVRLRDVLADAGVPVDDVPDDDTKHAQFMGAEAYGASIPIEKAVDKRGDVILAYSMNGEPLPADHGYPLRVLVPGTVAARSVKWVNKITMSDEESWSQWQRKDYKCFGPNEGTNPDWDRARSIQEMPVQSAITSLHDISPHSPEDRKLVQVYGLEEDSIVVEGYAFSGGGREILRVDISADDGRTWNQADLLPADSKGAKSWAWKRWRFALPKRQAGRWFVVKAVDEAYNTQPDSYEPTYNFRGNLTSAWHRVRYNKNRRTD
jgi:sulfite oxidase